jgi:hypothetical protein
MARANVACTPMQIRLPAGVYAIASPLSVSAPQTIVGDGAAQTIVDAGATGSVLTVASALTLSGVTLNHGQASGRGGGMRVTAGTVTATDVIFANNQASAAGGGLAVESGASMSCASCIATGNGAAGGAGVVVAGSLTWSDGEIASNTSSSDGGGVRSESGSVMLLRTLTDGNTALFGGGVSGNGTVTLQASTVANNQASAGDGGGLAQSGDSWNLENVTVSGNSASGAGGGVRVNALSSDTWLGVTISANQAASGGGVAFSAAGGLSLSGVLIAGNIATTDADCASVAATSGGHNLIAPSAGCLITKVPSDVSGDASLLPLTANGGPVPTHALSAGSAAIDVGPSGLVTDARGVSRPQGLAPDIGAFERGLAVLTLSGTSTPATAAAGATVLHTYQLTNLGPTPAVQVSAVASGPVLAASAAPGACASATCAIAAIAPGQSADVTLLMSGTLASTLAVHADNAPDVTFPVATTVTPSADLALTAIPASSTITIGAQTQVALNVLNEGPSDTPSATLTVTPGTETFLVAVPSGAAACTLTNGILSCALGPLAAGTAQTITLALSASVLGNLTFHAALSSAVADPDPANDTLDEALAVTGVDAQANAPASSTAGLTQAATSASKKGCGAIPAGWWALSLAAWWRRPRRSSSRR